MSPYQAYEDVPGIEGGEYLMADSFGAEPMFSSVYPPWASLDPHLDSLRHHYNGSSFVTERSMPHNRFYGAYDPSAHGFGFVQPQPCHHDLYRLQPATAWHRDFEHARHLRYVSPTGSGGSMTNSDSTLSDYALSPDMARGATSFSQDIFTSPISDLSASNFASIYPPPAKTLPSSPFASSHACSMKELELQYTHPDHHRMETGPPPIPEHNHDNDTIEVKLSTPQELRLAESHEQHRSPTDSGLGQSILDEDDAIEEAYKDQHIDLSFADEDDEDDDNDDSISVSIARTPSDSDSEFTPARNARKPTTTIKTSVRHSLRPSRTTSYSASRHPILDPAARVRKPSSPSKAKTKSKAKPSTASRKSKPTSKPHSAASASSKCYPCTFHHYGCTALFSSKNEWKRHVASQHLQLGYYRCDMGGCRTGTPVDETDGTTTNSIAGNFVSASAYSSAASPATVSRAPNDFNRKDLFTQHCRRMHAPWGSRDPNAVPKREREAFEAQMDSVRARCWRIRRHAPGRVGCGVCGQLFVDAASNGKGESKDSKAWEERMEHVGKHYEREGGEGVMGREKVDGGLREWAVKEGVVRKGRGGGWWLTGLEPAGPGAGRGLGRGKGGRRGRRSVVVQFEEEEEDQQVEADDVDEEEDIDADADADAESDVQAEEDDDTDAEGEDE